MHTSTRAVPALLAAIALTVTLAGCEDSFSNEGKGGPSAGSSEEKKTFRLGEPSSPQESPKTDSKGATFTVTPTRVETGTKADMDKSGLDLGQLPGPKIPVYVWSTLTHTGGKPMRIGDMNGDLVIRTDRGDRSQALFVLMGEAAWPNCPEPDSEKRVSKGEAEEICTAFLIPRDEEAEAVELGQGFHSEPLEWPVKGSG